MSWRDGVEVVEATRELIERIAPKLRAGDVEEIRASTGQAPLEHLLEAVGMSFESYVFLFQGEPAVIGGVVGLGCGKGSLWFLTTDLVERNKKAFVWSSKLMLREVQQRWSELSELVDARYASAIRWLKHLGAEIGPAASFGPQGLPFCEFTLKRG